MKRKLWLVILLLAPLLLAVPLWFAASWKPHRFGVHPIRGQSLPPFVAGARPTPPQYNLMISPDGARLLSISSDSKPYGLAMWDAKRGSVAWNKPQTGARDWKPLCFSPDGKTLAMASNPNPYLPFGAKGNPQLALFDAANGKQLAVLPVRGRVAYFADAVFSRDGQQLIAATGNEVRTWDVAARREVARVVLTDSTSNEISDVTLAPDGRRFIVSWDFVGSTPTPRHLGVEMRDAANHIQWEMATGNAPRFDFAPDGTALLASDQSSLFQMLDAQTGRVSWKKSIANTGFNARYWLPDSSAVAVEINDKFQMWDAKTGKVMRAIAHGKIQKFVIAPDGAQLYLVDFDGQIWSQRLK